jgi:hypothetical protein
MFTATLCPLAAGVVLLATSLNASGELPGVAINPDWTTAPLPRDELPAHDPDRLETRQPYERGKVPIVFIDGLWRSPRHWDRMIECLEADPALRKTFQFWTFGYASGNLIPYLTSIVTRPTPRLSRPSTAGWWSA